MKLLHLSSEYPPQQVFGLGRYVQEIAEIQAASGHMVHVITNSHGGIHSESQVGSLNVMRVHFPPPPKAPAVSAMLLHFNLQLIERCLEIRSDWEIINAHDWLTFPAAFHIARLLKRPLVTTLHDIVFNKVRNRAFDDEDAYVAGIENWACHVSAKVIVLSEVVREEVLRSYHADPSRIKVVPGATGIKPLERNELEILRAWRGQFAKDDENLLLYAGRLDPEKGIFTLLESVRELRDAGLHEWKVVLAGQGSQKKKIEEFITEHQLGSLVSLAGYLDHSTLRLAYAAADVVVVPSDYEPFGLVALEAQRMGTPVIVSNTGGLAETLSITNGGVSFVPGQSKELASKIHELLNKPSMRVALGKYGMQNTAEAYGWTNVVKNLDCIYEKVKGLPPPINLTPPAWTHPRDSSAPTEIRSLDKPESLNRVAIFWDTNQFAELRPLLEQLLGSHALNALDGTIHVIPVLLTGEDRPWTPPIQHPKLIFERLDGTPEAYEKILLSTAGVIAPAHLKPALLRSGLLDPQTLPIIWLDGKTSLDLEGFHAGDQQTLHISISKVLCDERFRRALAPKALQQIPQIKWEIPARERPLILHILPQLVTGGAEAVLLEIIKGSKDQFEHKIFSIGPLEGPLPAEFEATGVSIHKLDGAAPEHILSCISSEAPNLLHLHSMSYIPAWIRIHRQLADAPIIETEHVVNIGSGHFGPANRILCVSNATLKAHSPYNEVLQISGCQYEVVYNGLDLNAYEKLPTKTVAKIRLGLPLDRPIIGRVSALARNKLPMESLESIAILIKQLPEALFVIVGDGPQRRPAEEWVKKNGLEGHVCFLGERRDIPQVLCAFDVFAYYTTKDALPNVILEAVAAGVPVVTTDVEGTSEALGDAPGTLVTLNDFEAFSNAIVEWTKKSPGRRSKKHLNRLSREHMSTRYKQIYKEIISTSSIASEPVKTGIQVHKEDQEPVTILLPVFNTRKDWLDQALESVARQTYDNWKLIVLDDGSKKEVAAYIDALVQDKPNLRRRTRVMHLPENRGLPTALNIGIEASESRYLARMDSDDIIIPERIALQMAYLKQNPAIDVLGTNANLMDLEGGLFPYPTPHYNYPQKHPQILDALQRFSSIAHATTIYRRESILSAGGYDPKCLHYEDYDLWVRMAEKGFCFENIPIVTYLIRIHPDSVCQTQKEKQSIGSQKCMDRARKLLEKRLKTSSRN